MSSSRAVGKWPVCSSPCPGSGVVQGTPGTMRQVPTGPLETLQLPPPWTHPPPGQTGCQSLLVAQSTTVTVRGCSLGHCPVLPSTATLAQGHKCPQVMACTEATGASLCPPPPGAPWGSLVPLIVFWHQAGPRAFVERGGEAGPEEPSRPVTGAVSLQGEQGAQGRQGPPRDSRCPRSFSWALY